MGLEPTTFGFEVQRAIHYATEPIYYFLYIKTTILNPITVPPDYINFYQNHKYYVIKLLSFHFNLFNLSFVIHIYPNLYVTEISH